MIFVTLGTHQQPFPRLMGALSKLPPEQLVVQHGTSAAPAAAAEAHAFLPAQRVRELMEEAQVVITHAGVGSILCARRACHVPLVVPRRHALGEHLDDHQVDLTEALASSGRILPVWDCDDLPRLVDEAMQRRTVLAAHPTVTPLHSAVRAAMAV